MVTATATNGLKRVVIEPVTRVEGHGKVTILLDHQNKVKQARLHIVEFRGFERFIQGRPFWEVPVLVQRLCGICPVSHHLAAAKAMDRIVGGEKLTPGREGPPLMHYGQFFQSPPALLPLVSPDLLFGFDADRPSQRRRRRGPPRTWQFRVMIACGGDHHITAGKKIHGTGVPGGVNKNVSSPA